jgi:predicted DNA-binding transcriptional regulator YafY
LSTPAERLITLIMLLEKQPNQKAADLAAQLGVSVRTLQRYMLMLDEMGIPIYSERGPNGGFSLVRGYKLPPLVFTPREAAALYLGANLAEEVWGSLFQDAARSALIRLENVLPAEQRQEVAWAQRSLVTTGLQRVDPGPLAPLLETLRSAVREQRTVELTYLSSQTPHPTRRSLDAYALVYRWGWWYVIGYCHLRQALRSFRLDRIESAQLTAGRFTRPADFDVQAYLESEFSQQPGLLVRMRFAPAGAAIARHSRAYWHSLRELPDGSVEVEAWSPDREWAASSALAYGPLVTVLAPPEVAALVRAWALAAAQNYPEQSPSEEKSDAKN